ncbi:transposase [Streptomyces smyrnaeus]|uniref:transposase n=1 Tax=Streptomyces smyrnaeus TaxID=1387713 RepID=UPI003F4B9F8D
MARESVHNGWTPVESEPSGNGCGPFLPVSNRCGGRWWDHRQVTNGILRQVRARVQWRGLPEHLGPWRRSTTALIVKRGCAGSTPRRDTGRACSPAWRRWRRR